ncbi:MAG TPA: LysR substrate-binding domain-containing protein [Burkholderiales bacterium]|nr:LysR substrate-binding domain-containing protein [Burkholderiales bacterium]
MTLTEFKYIVAVANEGHFGHAAKKCFVSQPSLSTAIKNLEDELGVQIFERGKREVIVTPAGNLVIQQARTVLREAERVRLVANQGKDPFLGPFKLGIIHTAAPYLLPRLVALLAESAPGMPLDIEENQTANLDRMLREGSIEAAILSLPYEAPSIQVSPLYSEEFKAIVPAKHSWAKRRNIETGELSQENLLLLSIGHCFRDQILDVCHEFIRTTPGKEGNSLETIRNMVASGMGISVLPASALTQAYSNPFVKAIPFSSPRPTRRIAIACRETFPRQAVIECIQSLVPRLNLPVKSLKQD